MSSCVSFKIADFINSAFVSELGRMPLSLYVDTLFADARKEMKGFTSLWQVWRQVLERNTASGVLRRLWH